MLDNITKKNIDDCRDVLVGKKETLSRIIEVEVKKPNPNK